MPRLIADPIPVEAISGGHRAPGRAKPAPRRAVNLVAARCSPLAMPAVEHADVRVF